MSKTSPRSASRPGLAALEWAIVSTIIIMAMIKMMPLFYRGIAGMYNDSAKTLSQNPYDPKNTTSDFTVTNSSKTRTVSELSEMPYPHDDTKKIQVNQVTTTIDEDKTSRNGYEEVGALSKSLWDD